MRDPRASRLFLIRAAHTAIYVVMAASVLAVLHAGVTGAGGPWLLPALVLVGIETLIFVGSGMKCPMTAMASEYGAAHGHDTLLPERFTRHTLTIFGPLIVLGVGLLIARWLGVLG